MMKRATKMKKLIILSTAILLVLSTVTGVISCQEAPTPEPTPGPIPPPAPTPAPEPATPEFAVISLDVIPPEVAAAETTEITAIVKNVGDSAGTYAVILSVNGVTAEAKETALITPGSSTAVTFSLTKDTPGTYQVGIGELSSSLTVVAVPAEFKEISLDIEPPEAVVGEKVSITAVVENIGGSEGTYAAMLTMDGVLVEAKEVVITPGSSEVVAFSLVKDALGTYEVGVGELSSSLIVIGKEVELKYDDGTTDWSQAIGGPGRGHIVQFSPPSTPFTITKVKIFGKLYGTGYENLTFDVQIWDSEQKEIHSASYPHTEFSLEPTWVEIDIPDVTVSGDFYIHVFTNSPKEGGISIHSDSSVVNEHSEVTHNWEIVDWYLSSPKEEANWMIRVVVFTE